MNTNNHGGRRPGAGRKPSQIVRVAVSLYLSPEGADKFRKLRQLGVAVHEILEARIDGLYQDNLENGK